MFKYVTAEEKHTLWIRGGIVFVTWLVLLAISPTVWWLSLVCTLAHWVTAGWLGVTFANFMVHAQKRAVAHLLTDIHSIALANARLGQYSNMIDAIDLKVIVDETNSAGLAIYTRYWNRGKALIPAPIGADEEWENEADVFGNRTGPDTTPVSTESRRNRLWRAATQRFRRDSVLGTEGRDTA